jgi:hypothetical protein
VGNNPLSNSLIILQQLKQSAGVLTKTVFLHLEEAQRIDASDSGTLTPFSQLVVLTQGLRFAI